MASVFISDKLAAADDRILASCAVLLSWQIIGHALSFLFFRPLVLLYVGCMNQAMLCEIQRVIVGMWFGF